MKAVITGGAGFIGSNLAEELADRDHEVVVLDDLYLGAEDNLSNDNIEFYEGDVRNEEDLEAVFDEDVDVVFHQAARSSAPMHEESPYEGMEVNVGGFIKTIEKAREYGVDRVVYASTSSMYGSVNPPHSTEKDVKATNLYSASKMSREKYAEAYDEATDLTLVGLRYFSVYGPKERAKGNFANLISQFTWKLQNDESPVIYGDGSQTRDFTFVKDVVRANIQAAITNEEEIRESVYNVGTEREVTINDMVDILKDYIDTDAEKEHVENPIDNYVQRTQADISETRSDLDWEPRVDLEEGIDRVVKHYSMH